MIGSKLIIIDEATRITPEMIDAVLEPRDPDELRKQYMQEPELPAPPPSILSIESNSPYFHPCYVRVGVRIDGAERTDIAYYNMNNKSYMTERKTSHLAVSLEPYWRFFPSRQQRRAEQRWEAKHGRK